MQRLLGYDTKNTDYREKTWWVVLHCEKGVLLFKRSVKTISTQAIGGAILANHVF